MSRVSAICLSVLSVAVSASSDYQFVRFFYAIKSVESSQMTTEECQTLLDKSLYYNIVDNKPVYHNDRDSLFNVLGYNRLNTTQLNDYQTLYSGEASVKLMHHSKPVKTTESVSFVHDRRQKIIRGHMYIPGYCQASIFGLDTSSSS